LATTGNNWQQLATIGNIQENNMEHLYGIMEIFASIKGEGVNTGIPMVFVRFSGCNLNCWFCDTPHETPAANMNIGGIVESVAQHYNNGHNYVVFTGGEPALQLTHDLIDRIRTACPHITMVLESNGRLWNDAFDTIQYASISPKPGHHGNIAKEWYTWCRNASGMAGSANVSIRHLEVRYLVDGSFEELECPAPPYTHLCFSPIFFGGRGNLLGDIDRSALACATRLARKYNGRVSVQVHKLLGVR
jgi:7-carboxy-7-deazaguanine synthase